MLQAMNRVQIFKVFVVILVFNAQSLSSQHSEIEHDEDTESEELKYKEPRYLLYDVNPGEGFNLRRDVYMRIAVLVQSLNKDSPWVLVLPPWSRLYHWRSRDVGSQNRIPWSLFFDLTSLREFVPVMEFHEFLEVRKKKIIDEVYYLQNYEEGWDKWEDKMDKRPCITNPYHKNHENQQWYGWFFGYNDEVETLKVECISVMGHAGLLKPFLLKNTTARSIMLDRAETVLHDRYGDKVFWQVRRSMRFSKQLRSIGDTFRAEFLDSTDEEDKTVVEESWMNMKRKHGDARGGPFLAVHLRRADFVQVRKKDVPSLKHAAEQLKELAQKHNLKKIFVATDAPKEEYKLLRGYIGEEYEVFKFEPTKQMREEFKDGGVAIIDQWICAHARLFVGTRESTFSFRIQDEREILGFDPDMTFNRLCNENDKKCEQPTRWLIQY